jgi:hypothetical protein
LIYLGSDCAVDAVYQGRPVLLDGRPEQVGLELEGVAGIDSGGSAVAGRGVGRHIDVVGEVVEGQPLVGDVGLRGVDFCGRDGAGALHAGGDRVEVCEGPAHAIDKADLQTHQSVLVGSVIRASEVRTRLQTNHRIQEHQRNQEASHHRVLRLINIERIKIFKSPHIDTSFTFNYHKWLGTPHSPLLPLYRRKIQKGKK